MNDITFLEDEESINNQESDIIDTFLLGNKFFELIKRLLRRIKNVQKK